MRQIVIRALKNIINPNSKPPLGRWRLNYSEEVLGKTIDRANEDHCGTCVNPPKEEKANQIGIKIKGHKIIRQIYMYYFMELTEYQQKNQ